MSGPFFPLCERAQDRGLLDAGSGLIVAPTATGKSYIGRQAIRRALQRSDGPGRVHAFLVPYRALAAEVYDSFQAELGGSGARLRLVTGDHRDPIRPDQADLVIATYESFAGLVRNQGVRPGLVVADEVHLIADEERGPLVEGLLAQVLATDRAARLLALSAVVENAQDLANWLGIQLVEGSAADRTVGLVLEHEFTADLNGALVEILQAHDDQALVFCSSRARAERVAEHLVGSLGFPRIDVPPLLEEEDAVLELLPSQIAYHHAGLSKPVRQHIEMLFREDIVKVITCTPTLAAGVNLPAGVAVVRDVFRMQQVRGRLAPVLLPAGEVLNMLGRAGRPGKVSEGHGVVLIDQTHQGQVGTLVEAVQAGRGGRVTSQLAGSFEKLMRFVLAVIVERGETTWADVAAAFTRTLAYYEQPVEVSAGRTLREDLMEDLPRFEKARQDGILLHDYSLGAEGVDAVADSSGKRYQVRLRLTGITCDCPAATRWHKGETCKHQALVVHDLLFDSDVDTEAQARALYLCGHVFGHKLDVGTRLDQALKLLLGWGLIERVPTGWRGTGLGKVASASGFDLLLVHQVAARLLSDVPSGYREIARSVVDDFYADEKERQRWGEAVRAWLDEVNVREIKLPAKYRGDFEQGLERLSQACLLYANAATSLGQDDIAKSARDAAEALRYGVAPEVVPLMALNFTQLRRARARYLYDQGVFDAAGLAKADPAQLADPRRAPLRYVTEWVEKAGQIQREMQESGADRDGDPEGFDDLIAKFRLDPAAL